MTVDARKVALLAVVYASQGLAPGFAFAAVPVLLRVQGVSLVGVGFAGLLLLPMCFKFVLGPWADRLAAVGLARTWMSGLQVAVAVCFAALTVLPPSHSVAAFVAVVGLAYLLVAAVDVITDGIAVRLLSPEERPLGNAAQYGGYYAGAILSGGLFLAIEPKFGWAPAVTTLALMILAGLAAARALPEPPRRALAVAPNGAQRASVLRFLFGPIAWQVLLLLLVLDMPQNVGIAMVAPFLIDAKLTQAQVGLVYGTAGMLAAATGALLGGALLMRLPRVMAVVTAGVLQALSLFGFAFVATLGAVPLTTALAVVCVANALASAFNIALSSWFMDRSSPQQPATDYSVMSCAHTATFALAGPIAGRGAQVLGFPAFFAATGALALVLVFVGWPWLRRLASPRAVVVDPLLAAAPVAE